VNIWYKQQKGSSRRDFAAPAASGVNVALTPVLSTDPSPSSFLRSEEEWTIASGSQRASFCTSAVLEPREELDRVTKRPYFPGHIRISRPVPGVPGFF